jgi:hypothetical protein
VLLAGRSSGDPSQCSQFWVSDSFSVRPELQPDTHKPFGMIPNGCPRMTPVCVVLTIPGPIAGNSLKMVEETRRTDRQSNQS